jgi:1-acyl-sn-glycerol-3-phosphate acyltransferase
LQTHKEKLIQAWRLVCASQYLLLAAIVVPILFSPLASKLPKRRQLASLIYRRFYNALNIKLIIKGSPTSNPSLWVCNHISWLDILLLAGNNTVDFIAKTEVGEWPLVGYIVKKAGTVLIERENKFQAYRSLPLLQKRIKTGMPILVFPEGTTTNGKSTLPFKPMFYQAAVREKIMIQPISLQYFDSNGEVTDSVAFIDDDDFSTSLKRILNQPKITAEIHFLPPISAKDYHRKQLANLNQQAINQNLTQRSSINSKDESQVTDQAISLSKA